MSENDCDWLCSPHVGGAPSVERRFTWGWVLRVLAPVETVDPSLTSNDRQFGVGEIAKQKFHYMVFFL